MLFLNSVFSLLSNVPHWLLAYTWPLKINVPRGLITPLFPANVCLEQPQLLSRLSVPFHQSSPEFRLTPQFSYYTAKDITHLSSVSYRHIKTEFTAFPYKLALVHMFSILRNARNLDIVLLIYLINPCL
jgi:hypothetical protein